MIRIPRRYLRIQIVVTLAVVIAAALAGALPQQAGAAPSLTIQQITWSIIGLDSNDPTVAPQTFPVGVRVCNTGTAATSLTATFNWTSSSPFINLVNASPVQDSPGSLGPGGLGANQCKDIYYTVSVSQVAAAFDQTRSFTIDVSATDGIDTANVSTGQTLYIEHLISQNRNSTLSITGPTNVLVGSQYTWNVTASTATNGYEELEHFLTFCPNIYRLDSVSTTYSAPKPFTTDTFWADGCAWSTSSGTQACQAPAIKYGGNITYAYHVTIVGTGTCALQDMVYDFSGSSFHYNGDYPSVVLNITATNPSCVIGKTYKDNTVDGVYNTASVPPDAPITGYTVTVYQDTNGNNTYDSGTDLVAATTTSDSNGDYTACVTGDPTRVYFAGVDTSSPLVSGYALEIPASVPTNLGLSTSWPSGTVTQDFAFMPPGAISGFLYMDNGSGGGIALDLIRNGTEPGLSGQTITYRTAGGDNTCGGGDDGPPQTSAATGGSGQYTISGLSPGIYCLLAPATVGTNALEVSGGQPNPRQITVTAGLTATANTDFGYAASGGFSGYIYRDDGVGGGTAGNNLKDAGEGFFAGQTVTYYRDDGDGVFEPAAGAGLDGPALGTVTSNGSGQYSITGIAAGSYWALGPTTIGTYTVGTTNPVLVAVASGAINSAAANDIGYDAPTPATPGTISGAVYIDNNPQNNSYDTGAENGINAITVSLYLDDGDGIYEPGAGAGRDGSPVTTALSVGGGVGQGQYSFSSLSPGTYWVSAPATAAGNTLGTTSPLMAVVTAGGGSGGNNFGYDVTPSPGGISGVLFQDTGAGGGTAGDGIRNGTEPGINVASSVTYYLDDGDGIFEPGGGDGAGTSATVTSGTGAYSITGLTPGNYWVNAPDSIGTAFFIGSQNPLFVTVPSGTTVSNQNFAYETPGAMLVTVFIDTNANNTYDIGEPVYTAGTNVNLSGGNSAVNINETTDLNGEVTYGNLGNGTGGSTYSITLTVPATYTLSSTRIDGTLSGTSNPATGLIINPGSGQRQHTVIFGLTPPVGSNGTVSGTAFQDSGAGSGGVLGDNIQNGTEAGISGLTAELYTTGNVLTASTTTSGTGTYSFTGVTPGDYYVRISPTTSGGFTLPSAEQNSATLTVTSGGTQTANFAYDPPGIISGMAFQDDGTGGGTLGNNVKDGLEAGISGHTVTLYTSTSVLVTSTTTAASGAYTFTGVAPGDYYVTISPATSGSYALPPGEDTSATLTLTGGGTQTANFAYDPPGTVSGVLFKDDGGTTGTANNNTQDGDEGGVGGGITVTLHYAGPNNSFGDGDDVTTTTTTNGSGAYSFTGVPPGAIYRVEVDSGAQQVGNYLLPTAELNSTTFAITAGIGVTRSFAYDPLANIIGTVYRDENTNNIQDGAEQGIPNITVNLLYAGPDNSFGNGDDVSTNAITNSAGGYAFPDQPVGSYRVTVSTNDPDLPANYAIGTPNPLTIAPLQQGTNVADFGFDPPGAVVGTVTISTPGNPGIPNITVTLVWLGPDGVPGGGDDVTYTTTTGPDGSYSFPVIPAGNISVTVDTSDPDLPPGVLIASPNPANTTLTGGTTTQVDFVFSPPNGTISGVVFDDDGAGGGTFGDQTQNGSEAGLPIITVTLYNDVNGNGVLDAGDTVAATTSSGGAGGYSFTSLPPGLYIVDVNQLDANLPAGLTSNSLDPASVTLPLNGTVARNFSFIPAPVIEGVAYRDLNANGIQDAGEAGIPNITVTLHRPALPDVTATTDTNGHYLFDSTTITVVPGTYTVDVDEADPQVPSGFVLGTPDNVAVNVTATSISTVNFGFSAPTPASISGTVWLDANADAAINGGETRAASVPLTLYDNPDGSAALNGDETVAATTTTDGSGAYTFGGLAPGNYLVAATPVDPPIPTGSTLTTPANPAQVNGLAAGATVNNVNFGYAPPAPATISGVVFNDNGAGGGAAANGTQDGGEAGLGGVTVALYRDNGDGVLTGADTLTATTATSVSGAYSFSGVAPGTYFVVETDPSGFTSTTPNAVLEAVAAAATATVNFGDQPASNTIGGVVYNDQNFNFARDAGEPGIAGVTVELRNSLGVTIATTTTDAGGGYAFTSIPDGDYTVVEIDPAGYTSTTSNNVPVTLSGSGSATADFGDRTLPGAITGRVFNDNGGTSGTAANGTQDGDEAGIPAVTVQVFRDVNGNGQYDPGTDTLVNTASTTAAGDYTFTNLAPGSYVVVETDPSGYVSTTPNVQFAVVTSGSTASGVNFGDMFPVPAQTIVGLVWNDGNANGGLDGGEPGLPGVAVALYRDLDGDGVLDAGEPLVALTTTDAGGAYSFTSIAAGDYLVVETDPSGYTSTTPNTVAVVMTSGGTGTANFGDTAGPGSLAGVVFDDNGAGGGAAADGLQTGGEPGLGSVTVSLYRDVNGNGNYDAGTDALAGTASTNGAGAYSFSGLAPGGYIVVESDPPGYISTTPNAVPRTISAGASATADFGDRQATSGTLTGIVWDDLDSSGTLDVGELGIGSVTVNLYIDTDNSGTLNAGDTLVATASTNAGGGYAFTGLVDGNYIVEEVNPPGYQIPGSTSDTVAITIAGNSQVADFGDVSDPGALGGTVWNDVNANGAINFGEGGLPGANVNLYNDVNGNGVYDAGTDTLAASTTTGPTGTYSFPTVQPGAYIIVGGPVPGYTPTTPGSVAVVVSAGSSQIVNFGETNNPPPGTVFGMVWDDVNNNGLLDVGEVGIPGVTVSINNATITYITVTDSSGGYTFTGITAGGWTITETDPPGYASTTPNTIALVMSAGGTSGGNNFGDSAALATVSGNVFNDDGTGGGTAADGILNGTEPGLVGVTVTLSNGITTLTTITDANGDYVFNNVPAGDWTITETDPAGFTSTSSNTINVTLTAGNNSTGNNFGDIASPGTISGLVWNDADGSTTQNGTEGGLAGAVVTLYNDVNNSDTFDAGDTLVTSFTTVTGAYSFTGLPVGEYVIVETDPAGYTSTTPNTIAVTLTVGSSSTGNDFGDQASAGSVSGRVWNDADAGGTITSGELGIAGVTITLSDGVSTFTVTTDSNGDYIFTGVTPGDWTITETDPVNFSSTTPNTIAITLAPGGASSGNNFGDIADPGSITGRVWDDNGAGGGIAGNGIQDGTEPGLVGVTVQLRDTSNNVIATTTTDASGNYAFTNIPPGDYIIVEIDPTGYVSTTPNNSSVTVPPGGSANADFGDQQNQGGGGNGGGHGGQSDPPITKEASPSEAGVGDVVTFTIYVFNPSNGDFTNAVMVDTIPSELEILSVSSTRGQIDVSGNTVTVTIGTLQPGQRVTITIVTRVVDSVIPPVDIRNTANLRTDQGNFSDTAVVHIDDRNGAPGGPILPPTGERPLWVRFAGPLLALLLGAVLCAVGWLVWRRERAA